VERGRPDLYQEGLRIAGGVKRALAENRAALKELEMLPEGLDPVLVQDLRAQLGALFADGFVGMTPDPWLDDLPRLARAVGRRAHKLRTARATGSAAQLELRQWRQHCAALDAERTRRGIAPTPELERLRWLVEEYCVSLFAQELRTRVPVSPKRLQLALDEARQSLSNR
jgi:ATP-dependent helicase HrpA